MNDFLGLFLGSSRVLGCMYEAMYVFMKERESDIMGISRTIARESGILKT